MKRERKKAGGSALMLALSLGVIAMPPAKADVVDNWQVEAPMAYCRYMAR